MQSSLSSPSSQIPVHTQRPKHVNKCNSRRKKINLTCTVHMQLISSKFAYLLKYLWISNCKLIIGITLKYWVIYMVLHDDHLATIVFRNLKFFLKTKCHKKITLRWFNFFVIYIVDKPYLLKVTYIAKILTSLTNPP